MTEPRIYEHIILCPCLEPAEPEDPDRLCWFCRMMVGKEAHGPFELLTIEQAALRIE